MPIQNLIPCFLSQMNWSADSRKAKIHTTTKNIVRILYFVTVLCHIVNMSNMLNTVQHSNTIKGFLSINEEKTKPFLNTQ